MAARRRCLREHAQTEIATSCGFQKSRPLEWRTTRSRLLSLGGHDDGGWVPSWREAVRRQAACAGPLVTSLTGACTSTKNVEEIGARMIHASIEFEINNTNCVKHKSRTALPCLSLDLHIHPVTAPCLPRQSYTSFLFLQPPRPPRSSSSTPPNLALRTRRERDSSSSGTSPCRRKTLSAGSWLSLEMARVERLRC